MNVKKNCRHKIRVGSNGGITPYHALVIDSCYGALEIVSVIIIIIIIIIITPYTTESTVL